MKATAPALILVVALLSAACGEGRAIFNVDVLSFIQPSGRDTIRYDVPGGVPAADSVIPPQRVILPPGFGKSNVDSVQLTAAAVIDNTSGTGSIQFQVYFAKTQASVYTSTPYVTANGTISGTQPSTVQLLPPTAISLSDSVFNTDTVWVGVRAGISTNAGPNLVGRVRLTTLLLRVVIQDKFF